MSISELCQAFLISAGVLMHNGEPAGRELLTSDSIKVAIVNPGLSGSFSPETLSTGHWQEISASIDRREGLARRILGDHDYRAVLPDAFPSNIQGVLTEAISTWYSGDIEFVDVVENPDIAIFNINTNNPYLAGGFASFPLHQDINGHVGGTSNQYVVVNYESFINDEAFIETLSHEFGHNFGILHPFTVAEEIILGEGFDPNRSRFQNEETFLDAQETCQLTARDVVNHVEHEGMMGYGERDEKGWFDNGAINTIGLPKP